MLAVRYWIVQEPAPVYSHRSPKTSIHASRTDAAGGRGVAEVSNWAAPTYVRPVNALYPDSMLASPNRFPVASEDRTKPARSAGGRAPTPAGGSEGPARVARAVSATRGFALRSAS